MKPVIVVALLCAIPLLAAAQVEPRKAPATAQAEIVSLLNEFLARVDDPAMHERFWADDLVYVSARGVVRGKADILKAMRAGDTPGTRDKKPDEPKATFSAEEVKIRPLGADVAVLNFRLVQHAGDKTNYFRNSGTLVRRTGKWQVVSWQATKEQ
jgi:hypothetical protein